MTRLAPAVLANLPPAVAVPAYDRTKLRTGIVHLGVGAFHRAHQAVVVEQRLAAGELGWGITAASLRSPATRDALAPQQGLYTLSIKGGEASAMQVIGAIRQVLVAPEDPAALLRAMVDPDVRIVSLTITEKGYAVDLATGGLKADSPEIIRDLQNPERPATALGFLTEAIRLRRAAGLKPFTILSCDNLPGNGATLHRVLGAYASLRDAELGRYVAGEIACPSTMVDRIVPATTDQDRADVEAALSVHDAWPVVGEPFLQWVVEDRFPAGRPDLAAAGVELVGDVSPYEHMKLRLLNGAHSTLAATGRLLGHQTIAAAIGDADLARLVEGLWRESAATLGQGAGDPHAYTRRLLARFANPSLPHRTAQIATDASQKVPQRLLAPLQERLEAGAAAPHLTFAVAAWMRSCAGTDAAGASMPLADPVLQAWDGLPDQAAMPAEAVVARFLGYAPVFGTVLPRHPGFVAGLNGAYAAIRERGLRPALSALG